MSINVSFTKCIFQFVHANKRHKNGSNLNFTFCNEFCDSGHWGSSVYTYFTTGYMYLISLVLILVIKIRHPPPKKKKKLSFWFNSLYSLFFPTALTYLIVIDSLRSRDIKIQFAIVIGFRWLSRYICTCTIPVFLL